MLLMSTHSSVKCYHSLFKLSVVFCLVLFVFSLVLARILSFILLSVFNFLVRLQDQERVYLSSPSLCQIPLVSLYLPPVSLCALNCALE